VRGAVARGLGIRRQRQLCVGGDIADMAVVGNSLSHDHQLARRIENETNDEGVKSDDEAHDRDT
jgi:hypothetical protein